MTFGIDSNKAYVYKYDGTNFTLFHEFNENGQNDINPQITDDHQYIVTAMVQNDLTYVYKFNGASFDLLPNNGTFSFSFDNYYSSFSNEK